MQQNHGERKKTARKGMPHHQEELPFDVIKKPETPFFENGNAEAPDEPAGQQIPPKDKKSLREQKSLSVIRNRFINDETDVKETSMVKRVVDNLLHENKDDEINRDFEKEEMPDITEPVEEVFSENEEEIINMDEPDSKEVLDEKDMQNEEELKEEFEEEENTGEEKMTFDEMADKEETGQESLLKEGEKDDTETDAIEEEQPANIIKPAESSKTKTRLAKEYEKIHNILEITDIAVTVTAILVFLFFGWSRNLRDWIFNFTRHPWIVPLLYAAIITIVYYFVILIPLHAIAFHFENKFKLNNQSFSSWLDDQFKSLVLNMIFVGLFLEVTYFLLRRSPDYWWLWAGIFWSIFAVLLANIAPVLIMPLFYKMTPLKDDSLRERLRSLAERIHVKVLNVYEIKLSRKTKKANAMLAGLGNTKRILLGDTLLKNYSEDEIETIIAHELGHHYHHHIYKSIFLQTVFGFAGLFISHLFLRTSIGWFDYLGIEGLADIAGFPFLLIALFIFGILTTPLGNFVSRVFEKQSDKFALRLTDRPNEFISAMKKLANQNLADEKPSKLAEVLFHSHPSISNRISAAEDYAVRKRI